MTQQNAIVITGAGKGLGRAYALHLAKTGANIVVNNRTHEGEEFSSADQTVKEIIADGGNAVAEYSSIEDPDAGKNLLACALGNFGRIDALIANAAVSEHRSFRKQSIEEFRSVVEVNLLGTANVLHPIFQHLCEQTHGSVIICTSVAGLFGEHGLPAYSSSKSALLGLMYSLSKEGHAKGVRVNAVAPYAATQMTKDHLPADLETLFDAEKVAPVVTWLVSDQCIVNGEIIIAGGGRIARAQMMTTGSISAPQMTVRDWQDLQSHTTDREFDSAVRHFQSFVSDVKNESD